MIDVKLTIGDADITMPRVIGQYMNKSIFIMAECQGKRRDGVRWFINAIEQKFFKSPEEGGLPADKISFKETVDGEDLHIIRSMHAGCQHPGYTITNSSRRSHLSPDDLQTLDMADPWLFKGGLMDFLKEIADRYEQGTL